MYPKRWWNFCRSDDEKKEIEPIFIEKCFNASVVYNIGVSGHLKIVQKSLFVRGSKFANTLRPDTSRSKCIDYFCE